jgi:hypothetical protein
VTAGLLAGCLAAASAPAQEHQTRGPVFEPVRVEAAIERSVRCYVHERYIVVERELDGALGADLFVRSRATNRCDADSLPGDLVLRNEWAEYSAGIKADHLFIDSGTGPDLRQVIVVDLRTRERVLQRSYVDLESGKDSATVGIWDGFYVEEPLPGCPTPSGGLQPGVDSLYVFDLTAGSIRFANRIRCASRQ